MTDTWLPWAHGVATHVELRLWAYEACLRLKWRRMAETWIQDFVEPLDDALWGYA